VTDPRLATSLSNGLRLLEAFTAEPQGVSNADLARRSGLSRPSVSRLTTTLATRGLVTFDPQTRRYRLGPTALTIAYPLLVNLGVRRRARLPMKQLSDELGATISLGIADRTRMVYVETLRGNDPVAFQPDIGAPVPMLQSAMGRAWLVSAAAGDRDRTMAAIRAAAPAHYRRWATSLASARADLERHGFTLSRRDWQPDIDAVAVPLALSPNGDRLVLNCGLAARRLRGDDLVRRIGPRLLALAQQIEAGGEDPSEDPSAWPAEAVVATESRRGRRDGDWADRNFARTLARGIDLLLAFRPVEREVGNRELARRLGLSPQTVVRLTHTLRTEGYLNQDPQTSRYRLGPAILSAAYPMLSSLSVRRLARPAMTALSDRIGGAVSLGLRHGSGMIYVETAWQPDGRLLPPDIGAPMPMLATAMGRAWLARATAHDRAAVLNRIRLGDPDAHARLAGAAHRSIAAFGQRGYCTSRDFRPEIEAIAVPFTRVIGTVRFVLNCGVLAPRPLSDRRAAAIGAALMDAVRAIEARLSADQGLAA